MAGTSRSAYPLACPICERALERHPRVLCCPSGHTFDVAREGYVNLLPPQHKTRGVEGDKPVMLQARRRFLEAGHYLPLRESLIGLAVRLLEERRPASPGAASPPCILEVGCGEGYYVGGLAQQLAPPMDAVLLGADISKDAVRMASRRYPGVLFFVADTGRRLYLESGSVAVLLDVFAPRNPSEFARVLEPGGSALIAIPTDMHLAGLRDRLGLIGIQDDKERRVLGRFSDGFDLEGRAEIRFPLRMDAAAVRDLVEMGPNYWHGQTRPSPVSEAPVDTEAAFTVLHLRKK